jgi:hypothetical protein
MNRYQFTPQAVDDLFEIWSYIAADNVAAAESVEDAVYSACSFLEEQMSEKQFINYYRCPYDGTEWADVWSCCCNDMCPKCRIKDIEPYKSDQVVHTKKSVLRG